VCNMYIELYSTLAFNYRIVGFKTIKKRFKLTLKEPPIWKKKIKIQIESILEIEELNNTGMNPELAKFYKRKCTHTESKKEETTRADQDPTKQRDVQTWGMLTHRLLPFMKNCKCLLLFPFLWESLRLWLNN
jgi:hypothetical protein